MSPPVTQQPQIILLTGMSGAGKSLALKSLEDIGYEAIDNLPLNMLSLLLERPSEVPPKLALGVDVRSRHFSAENLLDAVEGWRKEYGQSVELVFMDCEDDVLQGRFAETRRKHPLAQDRPVMDGITLERELVGPITAKADRVMQTSGYSAQELKRRIRQMYGQAEAELLLFLTSFSFRVGVPRDADMVIDVRFLQNPHYVPELKQLTGREKPVGDYIEQDPDYSSFFDNLCRLVQPLLPRYKAEGKSYFTLAVGCTGGRHRSVYTVEKLAGFLNQLGYKSTVTHRELIEKR